MTCFNGPLFFRPGSSEEPTCFHGIRQAAQVQCECGCKSVEALGLAHDTGDGKVDLHDGQFHLHTLDLEISGRGFNWKFERTYRSGIIFNGPLGHNWEFNYNRRLFVGADGSVHRMDGYGRADRYEIVGKGFQAPVGFYTQLVENANGTFTEQDRIRTQVLYSVPDAKGIARMIEIRDRNKNRMQFEYDAQGQLVRVIDTLGRSIAYLYNAEGHLIAVKDFTGRTLQFAYDVFGDLTAVTSPSVIGTPNGNDFPKGKTTRYRYWSGVCDQQLDHYLRDITAPNEVASEGPARVTVDYESDPASPNVGRVLRLTIGGVHASGVPAGGTITYKYLSLGTAPPDDLKAPV